MPGDQYDAQAMASLCRAMQQTQQISQAITEYLDKYAPSSLVITDPVTGYQYYVLSQFAGTGQPITSGSTAAWPFKVYNTTVNSGATHTPQVQINGGDGFVASILGFVAQVNGTDNSTQSGMPPAYPQLEITGNGWVYAQLVVANPGTLASSGDITALDILFAAALPDADTANPQGTCIIPLAQITGYTGGGSPTFQVLNTTNTGYANAAYCSGDIQYY